MSGQSRPIICHGLRFEATRGGSAFREAQTPGGRIVQVHRLPGGKWRATLTDKSDAPTDCIRKTMTEAVAWILRVV